MKAILKAIALTSLLILAGCDTEQPVSADNEIDHDVRTTDLQMEPRNTEPVNEDDSEEMMSDAAVSAEDETVTAEAVLSPTEGNSVTGSVRFTATEDGVRVDGAITGLAPGSHGFHVHENGDCSAPDGTSAGGHYAPSDSPHGGPDAVASNRHMGDLGNLEVDDTGAVKFNFTDPVLAMEGDDSIIGKAVIVHAGEDDLTSQPSGAAGPRVACGVIRQARRP